MQSEYLGDALDFWKSNILQILQPHFAHGLRVVPMITDEPKWDDELHEAYSRILNVEEEDIFRGMNFTRAQRDVYFESVMNAFPVQDLFLDPDTGIGLREIKPSIAKLSHVRPEEITMLTKGNDRVVIVYQHAPRFKKWDESAAREYCSRIRSGYRAGYVTNQGAMLFFCSDKTRLMKLTNELAAYTGEKVAKERVFEMYSRKTKKRRLLRNHK